MGGKWREGREEGTEGSRQGRGQRRKESSIVVGGSRSLWKKVISNPQLRILLFI